MRKSYFFVTILLCWIPLVSVAQNRAVSGKVEDGEGKPVAGVFVQAKNTDRTTLTAADGTFSLYLPQTADILVFTFLGMETKEIKLSGNQSFVNVRMYEKPAEIETVVVTGYSQTTTRRMTGSVGVLTSDAFENKPQVSVDALLQGQLAGVAVTASSGQPGRSQNIRIRGTNTLSSKKGNTSPLWVVDGVPLQGEDKPDITPNLLSGMGYENLFINGVGNINPNDIETVSVLKDAAAAAIYGSRASNGVIVITTKRGSEGKLRVNYSGSISVTMMPQRDGNLMNSAEKLAWEQELWDQFAAGNYAIRSAADPNSSDAKLHVPIVGVVGMIRAGIGQFESMKGDKARQDAYIAELGKHTTDWFGEIFRHSVSTNHHLSLSGGSRTNNYYVSMGYTNEKGVLINDGYNRYSALANYSVTPNKIFKLDIGIDIANQSSDSPNLAGVSPFKYAYFANPYEKPYNDDGSYSSDMTYHTLARINGDSFTESDVRGYNILRELNDTSSATDSWSISGRLNPEVSFTKSLKLVGLLSYTFDNNRTDKINLKNTYAAFEDRFTSNPNELYFGSITSNSVNRTSYIARAHLAYIEDFGPKHTLSVIGGSEIRNSDSKTIYRKGYRYDAKNGSTSIPPPPPAGVGTAYLNEVGLLSGDYYSTNRFASFYLSSDYSLLNRYVLNVSLRADGSSYFGSKRQFSPTWSAGAAWHMADEPFMQNGQNVFSQLSLRFSSGFTGNVNIYTSPYLIMTYRDQEYRRFGSSEYDIGWFAGTPNPNLAWEKTFDYKASLEFGLFNDRITGLVEWYSRLTTGVVDGSDIPALTGWESQNYNSVNIRNSGIEFTLGGKIVNTNEFRLGVSMNFSYNVNRVAKLLRTGYIDTQTRYLLGYPLESVWSGKLLGIDSYTGLYEFQLRSDAVLTNPSDLQDANNYRFFLGTFEAPYTGGFNLNAYYKGFNLSVMGVYSWGSKSFEELVSPATHSSLGMAKGNALEMPQTGYSDLYTNHLNVPRDRVDRWVNIYDEGTKYPRIVDAYGEVYNFAATNPTASGITSGAYMKDNSYVRIKSIILSYDFPKTWISRVRFSDLKMHLSLNNFFTFTNYEGLDPETPGALYPITRSVTFGLSVGF